jgi:hypothetical protein
MQVRQIVLRSFEDKPSASLAALKEVDPHIVMVFGHFSYFKNGEGLLHWLAGACPHAIHVGCSSAGEIAGQAIEDDSLIVTAIRFDTEVKIEVVSALLSGMDDSYNAGSQLVQKFSATPEAVIVLSPGTHVNGSALIQGMKEILPDSVPISGGLAGDQGDFIITYTLFNRSILSNQVIAIGLSGAALDIYHGSFGGWQPFGPVRKVTRCEGNVLFELDGQPAIQVYRHYLGEHAKGLPATSLLFPFAVLNEAHEETGLIRTILGIDDEKGALILAGDIAETNYVKLMHASTDRLVEGAQLAAQALMKTTANYQWKEGLGLLISCVGRKLVMGDRVDEELEAVAEALPPKTTLAGFYSYGEISPYQTTTDCRLHNQTMTITYLSERI